MRYFVMGSALGSFAGQLTETSIRGINIEYEGAVAAKMGRMKQFEGQPNREGPVYVAVRTATWASSATRVNRRRSRPAVAPSAALPSPGHPGDSPALASPPRTQEGGPTRTGRTTTDQRHHRESGPENHRDPPDLAPQENDHTLRCWTCNSD